MNKFTLNFRYLTAGLCLFCAMAMQSQNYGALQHLLQKRPANERFESKRFNNQLFFGVGAGANMLLLERSAQTGVGANVDFYFGKWITPVNGLRLGASVGLTPSSYYNTKMKLFGAKLDYLLNISALAYGYNPSRVFELYLLTGIGGGYSRCADGRNEKKVVLQEKFYYGLRGGLQANVRVSPTVDLYLEPVIGIYNDEIVQVESWRNYRLRADLMMGLTYTPAVPMGNKVHSDEFQKQPFFRNMFFSVSGGIAMLKVPTMRKTFETTGSRFDIGVGKWFNPVSALRLSFMAGISNIENIGEEDHMKHFALRADYMLNFNNLFWGFDKNRLFTLNGVAGVSFGGEKGIEKKMRKAPGLGIGLQGNFRITPTVDLYLEPRMNIYPKRYANSLGVGNSDQLGELSVGFTYHGIGNTTVNRRQGFDGKRMGNNLFMTSGIGAQVFLNKNSFKHAGAFGPTVSLAIGKWLSPFSGVRVVAGLGTFKNYQVSNYQTQSYFHCTTSIGLDYMWNISSTLNGYSEDRIFELIGLVGAQMAFTSKAEKQWQPGVSAGVQTLWHLNDFLGIYLEPQLRLYGSGFAEGRLGFMKQDMMFALQAGFHYRFAPYMRAANREAFDKDSRKSFASLSVGASGPLLGNKGLYKDAGFGAKISYGQWFNPLSAWRVNLSTQAKVKTPQRSDLYYWGVGADYMFSLATLAKGYNPESVLDVLPYVGLTAGVSHRDAKSKMSMGMDFGFQIKLRLNRLFDVYLEPEVGFRTDGYDGMKQNRADRLVSLQAGVQYKF